MVILDTPFVTVSYDYGTKALIIKWLANPGDASFAEVYFIVLKFALSNHQVRLFCTDLTCVGALTNEQEAWLNQEYYQMAYAALQEDCFVAVVFSEEHFNAIVTHYQLPASSSTPGYIHMNYFTDQAEALHWLAGIKKGQEPELLTAESWPVKSDLYIRQGKIPKAS